MKNSAWAFGLICVALQAHGDIYKYVDEHGITTYTNLPETLPKTGASRVIMDPPSAIPGARQRVSNPADFPRVDGDTQKKRDESRRQILEDELRAEEKLLSESKQALADGGGQRAVGDRDNPRRPERLQGLKEEVAVHEKNISALKKELANLK
jgi:uncharacterized protein DUF4124